MKSITVARSKEIEDLVCESRPNNGVIAALEFSKGLVSGLFGGYYDKGNHHIKGLVDSLRMARRVTLYFFLRKSVTPGGFVVCLRIAVHGLTGEKSPRVMESRFDFLTGDYISY
jgi:hypothetical protein